MKIVVPFYSIDVREKEDYFKICSDATGGKIFPVAGKSTSEIIRNLVGETVHVHGRGLMFPESSCLFAKRKIYTPHFNVVGVTKRSSALRSRLWNRYDKVIALTDYAKKNFIQEGISPRKVEKLPLPIDFDHYSRAKGGMKFRRKLGLERDEPFVLVIGLRKGKNIDVIARACGMSGVRCVMVGPTESEAKPGFEWLAVGNREKDWMSRSGNVIFTGRISDDEMLRAMDASTIFALSSDHTFECFSLVTYQCAALGKPLCLPDFGVFDSFKGAALFHRNRDARQLASNISRYLKSKRLMSDSSKKARAVAKEYDYRKVRKTYKEFYERIGFV